MKVLLVNPHYAIERYMGRHLARIGWVMPPMGLLYIAASLERAGVDVSVYDAQIDPRALPTVLDRLQPDVVGITCTTALVESSLFAARLAKESCEKTTVVAGGVHPTVRPEDVLSSASVDIVIRGEGISAMVEVVRALEEKKSIAHIEGVSFKEGARHIIGPPRDADADVDRFPLPARHLVEMNRYRMSPDWSVRRPFDIVFTAFGCPHKCIFCSAQTVSGARYRPRRVDRVMDEIDLVIHRYGIRSLLIGDDTFTVFRDRAMEFCEQYSRRGYNTRVPWSLSNRVDTVDAEILHEMKRAGCSMVSFGVETGVQRLLDILNKGITVEQSVRAVRLAKEAGLRVRATFILGVPTETREESLETIKFSRSLPLDQVRFGLATPFPGTELWQIGIDEGSLQVDDWMRLSQMAGYTSEGLVYVPEGRNGEELKRLQRWANFSFFFRPRTIFEYLTRVRSPGDILQYSRGALELARATLFSS